MSNNTIAFLNGTVITTNGTYEIENIEVEAVKQLIQNRNILSAIGHVATAELLSEILDVEIPFNRVEFTQEVGQIAIAFKLNKRSAEGTILSKEDLLEIGYTLKKITRLK